ILRGHQGWVTSVAFSPDGQLALTGSQDQTARVWEVTSGRALARLEGHHSGVESVAFSPDGRLAICCDNGGRVSWWGWGGVQGGRLMGLYAAAYPIMAIRHHRPAPSAAGRWWRAAQQTQLLSADAHRILNKAHAG